MAIATGVIEQLSLVDQTIKIVFLKFQIFDRYFFENFDRYIYQKKKLDKNCPNFNPLHAGILGFA